jgi:hypothetical protein
MMGVEWWGLNDGGGEDAGREAGEVTAELLYSSFGFRISGFDIFPVRVARQ